MPKINPAVKKAFDTWFREAKLSPEHQLLASGSDHEAEFLSWVEELVWQGFLCGLHVSRQHSDIFSISCHHCNNSITQSSDNSIITFPLAEDEGWVYDYEVEVWTCSDCAGAE